MSLTVFTHTLGSLQFVCYIYLEDVNKLKWFSFQTSQSCFPLFLNRWFNSL